MNFRAILGLFRETFRAWGEDKVSRLAAALSYYTIFSIAPLLIIVIAIAGAVFGEAAAQDAVRQQLDSLIGNANAEVIQTAIQNVSQPQSGGVAASIISVVILLFGATGVFIELQDALNTIWEVQLKPGRAVKNIIRQRFISFAMVLAIGFLLIVSLVVSAVLQALVTYFSHLLVGIDPVWQLVNFVLGFIVTTLLFGLIFKVLPDVKITWNDVLIGAALTSLLFSIGRYFLGQYISNSSFGSAYGAAGSLVVILAWVYYAAQILFFGAEFTQVYATRYGSRIVPTVNAVPMTEEARQKLGLKPKRNAPQSNKSKDNLPKSNMIRRLMHHFYQQKRLKRKRGNRHL